MPEQFASHSKMLRKAVAILAVIVFSLPLMADSRKPQQRVAPIYPELARRMHIGGVVKVDCMVDAKGKVISAKALSGHPLLVGAAENAVLMWKFEPGTSDSDVRVDVVFNIE